MNQYHKNPRILTKEQHKLLKRDLKELGDLSGIVHDINSDEIIGGNQRSNVFDINNCKIEIVKEYKKPTKTGTVADGYIVWNNERYTYRKVNWTDKQCEKANIVANKAGGNFDFDILANEFEVEDLLDWGFDEKELVGLDFGEGSEGLTDEDSVPEVPEEPTTKKGDLYILGEHRLLCGDSVVITDVEKLMNGQKADMVFTDPPYNTGMNAKSNSGSTRLNHMFNDKFTPEEWLQFIKDFLSTYYSVMNENTGIYICLDWRRNHELVPEIKKVFELSNIIIWDKVVHGLGSDYKYTYELINVCKKGKPELDTHQGDREYSDVWHIQRKVGKNKEHATAKPTELVERCLRHASKPNSLCVDLFLGSGTTVIACEKLHRKCYGMEIDPGYCDVIVKRWEEYTGKKAELINEANG